MAIASACEFNNVAISGIESQGKVFLQLKIFTVFTINKKTFFVIKLKKKLNKKPNANISGQFALPETAHNCSEMKK